MGFLYASFLQKCLFHYSWVPKNAKNNFEESSYFGYSYGYIICKLECNEGLPGLAGLPLVYHLSSEMVDLVPSDFNEIVFLSLLLLSIKLC